MYQKLEVSKNYPTLPNCNRISIATEQLHISLGSLLNFLRYEAASQNKASLFGPRERKRRRYGKNQDVDQGLWKWFQFAQSHNAPVNRILKQKAEEISKQLGHDEFTVSKGWFYRWKKRHDLTYIKVHGEASKVNTKAAVEWTSKDMQELLKRYEPANIYNADETTFIFEIYQI